jgi:FemAB-related protein (PEP-CTERM system-associated)
MFQVRHISPDGPHADRVDAFVCAQSEGTPFHRPNWARAVEAGCGQKTLFLVAEDGAGDIAGLLPLTHVRSRLFGDALVSSGFAVGGGILATSELAFKLLEDAARHYAVDLSCPRIELRGGRAPAYWSIDDQTYVGFDRPLAKDDEAELLAIPRKARAEVRKAISFELETRVGASKQDLADHFSAYSESVRNLGTPVFPKALFAAVLKEFGNAADILTVCKDGKAVSSVLSLYHNGTVMPYWGGGTREARHLRANEYSYYALMCHARARKGCTHFDFGRSKVGTGAASFKKNMGFEGKPLAYGKWQASGAEQRDINPQSGQFQARVELWKKLPLWLANKVGPHIAKGLG